MAVKTANLYERIYELREKALHGSPVAKADGAFDELVGLARDRTLSRSDSVTAAIALSVIRMESVRFGDEAGAVLKEVKQAWKEAGQ